ncbi:type 1 glutamine amidotransferase [Streptomyces sp. P38-E01]|uniref:Type 1 glutamine amidotransferase n=1 Tax=Streptomyces tardus TaxID=2780544 RepID=A0A949N156_9ACTN|nr:type 1 glutamine amidotransferase domain-containing protein [Streptomyces tardus]MBU7597425.1 type 1 glutamine amidotransferase [Streptomyces tardus]
MRIAFLVANEGVEQVELTEPWQAVRDAGGETVLLAPQAGEIQAFHHLTAADTFPVDLTVDRASVTEFDGLVLPGGVANPDALRLDGEAVAFVKAFRDLGKPIAAICHAPWTLIEADVVRARTLTSWPSLRTDIRNAGGTWVDEEVKVCTDGPNPLVTSRKPDDLPAFNAAALQEFSAQAGAAA